MKCRIWSMAFYGAETWTLRQVDQKYLEGLELRCWRRMEIIWTNNVKNEEVLRGVEEERNILQTINRGSANWIDHILRRNSLKHVTDGITEERSDRNTRKKTSQLLDDLKGNRGYWKLKTGALDHTLWRTRFGRGYGPVVRLTAYWWRVPILMEFTPL